MGTMTYTFIAFPKGKRTVIATMHGMDRNYEAMVAVAAMRAGVSAGSEADAMVTRATVHARLRGEYIDVERDGSHLATVGPEGVI
jgi:hypothetical protein